MRKPIYIYGAGGLGKEINAMLLSMTDWKVEGFFDDHINAGKKIDGVVCMGGIEALNKINTPVNVVIAIGSPQIKLGIAEKLSTRANIIFPSLVHPSVCLLNKATIILSAGCVLSAGCILTTDIRLGLHSLININTTIGHDSVIGDGSSIMPGVNVAGQVTIGKCVLVGSGANILNGVTVADNAIIGSGAVVTKNVRSGVTVVGVPAKEI